MKNINVLCLMWLTLTLLDRPVYAGEVADSVASDVAGDQLLTTALNTGNTSLTDLIKKQDSTYGKAGLQDPTFRSTVQADIDSTSSESGTEASAGNLPQAQAGAAPLRSDQLGNNNNQFMASLLSILSTMISGFMNGSLNSNNMFANNSYSYSSAINSMFGSGNSNSYGNQNSFSNSLLPSVYKAPAANNSYSQSGYSPGTSTVFQASIYNNPQSTASNVINFNGGQSQYMLSQGNQYRFRSLPTSYRAPF